MSARRLEGRVCVVTGASSGIGRAVAGTLAEKGARVVGLARRFDARAFLRLPEPGAIAPIRIDVTDAAGVETCFAEIARLLGSNRGVDVLVNAAGSGHFAPLLSTEVDELRALLEVHVVGSFLCSREALRIMAPQGRGHIVNIGSLAAVRTFAECAAYTAAKAGQLGLGRVLAEEARPAGVRVTTLIAGAVDTPIWDHRPGFDRSQMMRAESIADVVVEVIDRPEIAVEEILLTPPVGVL
ncbi:MAG: SDR family oxidoreductase [Proteobacteria bacterium]|nr:SDR family oxidoreductase [Pseudomonadota bacterium]